MVFLPNNEVQEINYSAYQVAQLADYIELVLVIEQYFVKESNIFVSMILSQPVTIHNK